MVRSPGRPPPATLHPPEQGPGCFLQHDRRLALAKSVASCAQVSGTVIHDTLYDLPFLQVRGAGVKMASECRYELNVMAAH